MPKPISNIIFSMNRPLQFEAYLESLYRHIPRDLIQSYVIYKVNLFDEQYAEVFKRFPELIVIREENFHDDFVRLIEKIDTKYILFATDDVVYFDSVDFGVVDKTFERFSNDIFGFTFKFGPKNLQAGDELRTETEIRLSPQELGDEKDTITEMEVAGQKIYKLNWQQGKSRNSRYPFELDCTIYRSQLVKMIISNIAKERPLLTRLFARDSLRVRLLKRVISLKKFLISINTFHAPNSLETYGYKWCRSHKSKLPSYLYFQKLCASGIQVNTVNASTSNPTDHSPEYTVEAINEKFKKGYRLDIENIEINKPNAVQVGRRYFKLVKDTESDK